MSRLPLVVDVQHRPHRTPVHPVGRASTRRWTQRVHPRADGDGARSARHPTRPRPLRPEAGGMTAHAFTAPPPAPAAVPVLHVRGLTMSYGHTTAPAGVVHVLLARPTVHITCVPCSIV